MSTPSALGLDPEKTAAQVTVYQGAFEAFLQKKLFEFIKEDGLVLLGGLFFFEQEPLPTLTESSVFVQQSCIGGR